MVFLVAYCNEAVIPYEGATHKVPVVMMIDRWDGFVGFPGGKVEASDESLIKALRREVFEEIGLSIGQDYAEKNLEPLATFKLGGAFIHSYALHMPYEEMKRVAANAFNSQHFGGEITGIKLTHITDYGNSQGFPQFLQNNFIATAKAELLTLVSKKQLF
jgi:U8 snoRNA-decapping enzyme